MGSNTRKTTATNKADFLVALEKKSGNVTEACKAIGITRNTYYEWLKADESFSASCKDVQEGLKDFAESKLHAAIEKGSAWAICFFLKCRAKDRGYVERSEVTGKDGGPIESSAPMFHVVFERPKES